MEVAERFLKPSIKYPFLQSLWAVILNSCTHTRIPKYKYIYTQVIPDIMDDKTIVLIKVSYGTREALKAEGIKGDTYEVIIKRLLKQAHRAKRKVVEVGELGYV